MKLVLILSIILTSQAQAFPILNNIFKPVPIEKAHIILGEATEPCLKTESLKVVVWNIRKAIMKGFEKEFKKFGENKDIFLIQEAYLTKNFEDARKHFSQNRWDMAASFENTVDHAQSGTMIGSKVAPDQVKVTHSVDIEPIVETPKATIFAKYPIQGAAENLLVISVHAINIVKTQAFINQMEQIKTEILAHHGPVLLAGDFNTHNLARLNYLLQMVELLGLTQANWTNGNLRMTAPLTKNYLDHAFVRGIKIDNARAETAVASDHGPLFLELTIL